MKQRKIIILGAGASIGSKRYPIQSSWRQVRTRMPSAENFFYDLFKTNRTEERPAGFVNWMGVTYESLNDFIVRYWNISSDKLYDPSDWKGVNIEEVMTFFEIGEKMSLNGTNEHYSYKKAREHLLDFMYPFIPMICWDQHCEYLLKVISRLDNKDSIISYNWDTIVDFSLSHLNNPILKNYAKLLRDERIEPEKYRHTGLLLKLHGSFNWMVCQNKSCSSFNKIQPPFIRKTYRLSKLREQWNCKYCGGGKLKPQIIPPVSNKMIHKDSFFKSQWLIVKEKLLDATELVFIGYSFPPTDYYSEWLFRQLNFIENPKKSIITVVNPEYSNHSSLVYKRYNSLFKGHDIRSFKSLKEYSKMTE